MLTIFRIHDPSGRGVRNVGVYTAQIPLYIHRTRVGSRQHCYVYMADYVLRSVLQSHRVQDRDSCFIFANPDSQCMLRGYANRNSRNA
jgi:hypothetical protein